MVQLCYYICIRKRKEDFMFGWVMYFLAFLVYNTQPATLIWLVPFGVGVICHIKWWAAGTIGFLVGAGWKKPF